MTGHINIAFILVICGLFACNLTKNITGIYYSKFAVYGFFVTTIELNADSTFEYVIEGDLMYERKTGRYQIYGNKLFMIFNEEIPDTNNLFHSSETKPLKTFIHAGDTIRYNVFNYIGQKKLFPAHIETGKKVTNAKGYSQRKKFVFFGSQFYKKRFYYKRAD